MSPIGRIFSVLNLVLAALFIMWASNLLAVSQDYKAKLEAEEQAHEQTRTELNATVSELRTQLDTARNDADLARGERDDARNAEQLQRAAAEDAQKDNASLQASYDKIAGSVADLEANNRNLQGAKDTAVKGQHDAEVERDAAQRAQQVAETRVAAVETENASLKKTISDKDVAITSLNKTISSLETEIATLVDVTGVAISDITAQPLIEGTVMKALYDIEPGMIAINKGSDDGVKNGHTFEIASGTDYKGQVRVENVRANMCTAIILKPVPGQTIRQGDMAKTRF